MANIIIADGLNTISRTMKSGKTVERSAIGVALSGNKSERSQFGLELAWSWVDQGVNVTADGMGGMAALVHELTRIFPTLADEVKLRNDYVSTSEGYEELRLINVRKKDVLALFALADARLGFRMVKGERKAVTGDKAILIEIGRELIAREAAKQAALKAQAVDTTAREVAGPALTA